MAKRKRSRSRRRRSGVGSQNLMTRAKVFGVTAVYGWAKEQKNYLTKVPKVDSIGLDGTVMVAAHLYAKHGPRFGRKVADLLATGLAGANGLRFGSSGFQMTSLQGYSSPGQDYVGSLDPADFLAEDQANPFTSGEG